MQMVIWVQSCVAVGRIRGVVRLKGFLHKKTIGGPGQNKMPVIMRHFTHTTRKKKSQLAGKPARYLEARPRS